MKLIKHAEAVKGSVQLGLPESLIQPIGICLLIITILYIVPRTAVVGCFLLAAYLGGAAAIMLRAQSDGHPYFFPVVFGIVGILAEYLRNARLRKAVTMAPDGNVKK